MAKKLNKEQLQAIEHGKGPLLIIAGAGTGKTTVITERIKYLITNGLAKPEEILALTFTDKAATEMEQRVDESLPLSYGDIWITTFHSFCDRILRQDGLHIGLPTNFKLMNKEKSIDLFRRNLFDFSLEYFRPLGNPNKFIESILSHFSRLQDELITPDDYLNWVRKKVGSVSKKEITEIEQLENKKWMELATVYKEYNKIKLNQAKFDFGDLIIKTVELFEKRPNILDKYQEQFKYILVDEYQDTNYGQNELVNEIAKKYKNITVVGDDNQSIYAFRGAAISNIMQFLKKYKDAKKITLNTNYRSLQTILDSSYKLIKHNDPDTLEAKLGISKKLKSSLPLKGKKYDVQFIHSQNGQDEASRIVDEIKRDVIKDKYNWNDIAILVRANNHADPIIREMERSGIPHQFLGPSKLFEREEIIDLISYLKSLYNPEDSESFYRLISSKIFNIDAFTRTKVNWEAKKRSLSLYEVIAENNDSKFQKLLTIFLDHLQEIDFKTAGEILYEFLQESGIYETILQNEEDVVAKNIAKFFEKIKLYEDENPKASFKEVVDYLNLLIDVGESPTVNDDDWQKQNAVNILTVHGSKGLEFPIVYLINLVNERFPSRNRSEDLPIPDELIKEELPSGDFHLQEERRLFYVGMTRAKERLYFTASDYYSDGKRLKKISPFVFEALDQVDITQVDSADKILFFNNKVTEDSQKSKNKEPLIIDYLSVSQIETFNMCPLHYKLKYIYKILTPMSPSISFGISIHETLRNYFETNENIISIYKKNFIEEGYENKKHKDLFYKRGEEYLLGFLKNGFDTKVKTVCLEKDFKIKINPSASSGQVLTVGGKIDRVDDLGGDMYEVIDYKTGTNLPTQKEVDKDLQLSIYAMAVSQIFNVDVEKIRLSLYYFDKQEKISTSRTAKQLEEVRQGILDIKKEIEESDFKCNNSYFCQQGCEYKMFCKSGN